MRNACKFLLALFAIGWISALATFRSLLVSKQEVVFNVAKSHENFMTVAEAETTTARHGIVSNDVAKGIARIPFDERNRVIFYNRIAKCGSRSLWEALYAVRMKNKFVCDNSKDAEHEHPPEEEVLQEIRKINDMKPPMIYNRHIFYLDFKAYNYTPPIYINMIREPIQRFISHYNYIKHGDGYGHVLHPIKGLVDINTCVMGEVLKCSRNFSGFMFYMGMYFCGHDEICKSQSRERVEIAKKHIDEEFTVIGATEEFENTILLLERMFPGYFHGAHFQWKSREHHIRRGSMTKKRELPLTDEAVNKLKNDLMKDEYEVYYHALAKFERLKEEYGIS